MHVPTGPTRRPTDRPTVGPCVVWSPSIDSKTIPWARRSYFRAPVSGIAGSHTHTHTGGRASGRHAARWTTTSAAMPRVNIGTQQLYEQAQARPRCHRPNNHLPLRHCPATETDRARGTRTSRVLFLMTDLIACVRSSEASS